MGGGGDLAGELERWLRDVRIDEAAAARGRRRWLHQQASEESTLAGALLDRAESGSAVVVHGPGGRVHRGRVTAVAEDFFALRTAPGRDVLLRHEAVSLVRPEPGTGATAARGAVASERRPPLAMCLGEALAGLAAERPRVQLTTRDGTTHHGRLVSVGADVATLELDGDPAPAYVPLAALAEVSVTA